MPFKFGKNKGKEKNSKILFENLFLAFNFKKIIIFVIFVLSFFIFSPSYASAASRYWVGGTGNWDTTDTTHWSASSGGTGGATIPGSGTDVFFDENSGTGTATITGGTVFAKTLTQTNGTGTLNVSIVQSNTLNAYGNFTLLPDKFSVSSSTYQFRYFGSGTLISAGNTLGEFLVQGASVAVVLGDALTASKVTFTSGTLTTGSFTHNWGIFSSNNSNTRVFDGTGSTINITGTTGTVWDFSSTVGLTFTAPSLISLSSATGTRAFNGGGSIFNNLSLASSAYQTQFTGDITINGTFTISAPNIIRVTGGKTITMGPSSSIVWDGSADNLIDMNVVSGTTPWIITRPSGTQTFLADYLNLGYSTATEANTFYASNSTNGTGNTNWTFANVPDVPTGLTPTAGNTQASLSWTAPVSDGGSSITDYVVEYKPTSESSWSIFADGVSTLTTATVTGLTNGTSYDFRVSAVNAIGQGSASTTATTTPYNPLDRYWVGGTATWDATAGTKWAYYSGGTGGASVPTSSNDVYFDNNSGTGTATITGASAYAKSLTQTNGTGILNVNLVHNWDSYIYGNVTLLPSKFTMTSYQMVISANSTIISAGNTISNLNISGTNIIVTLADSLNASLVRINNGTLVTGVLTHNWGTFYFFNNANTKVINMTGSIINLSGNNATAWDASSSGVTVISTGSTINCIGAIQTFIGGGKTYGTVNFTGTGTVAVTGANTFSVLSRTNSGTDKTEVLTLSADQTIANNGTLTLKGVTDNRYRLLTASNTLGTRRTITLGAGVTTDIQRADFRDIGFASPIDLSGITGGAGDALGNNNITFNTPRNMYWKTSTSGTKYYSNYDSANPWYSQTNGGGTNYTDSPLPQDNVFFDNNSIGSTSTTISIDQPRAGTDINFTGVTNSPTVTQAQSWTGYGSLTLVSAMTFSQSTQWNLEGRGNHTLDFSTQSLHYGAIYAIGSSSSYTAVSNITAKAIWFNYNVPSSSAGTLNMGSYLWNMTSTNSSSPWFVYSGTINAQTSTLQLSGNTSSTVYVLYETQGNNVYNNINISGIASSSAYWQFDNSFTVNGTFTIATPNRVRVTGGKTITMGPSSSIVWNGSGSNVIDINSTNTTPWNITKSSGVVDINGVSMDYSTASGGATFRAHGSTDGGHNSGWTFVVPRFWVGGAGNWSDTAHWSLTSGGAGGQTVPTSSTDVFLDANSGSGTVSVDATAITNDLNCTGFTGALYGSVVARDFLIYGSMTLSSSMLITQNVGLVLSFWGNTPGRTITTAGQTLSYLFFSLSGGNITLMDNVTVNQKFVSGSFSAGTLVASNRTITLLSGSQCLRLSTSGSGVVDLTNTTVNFSGGNQTPAVEFGSTLGLTTTGSTINIAFSSSTNNTFTGGNHTFNVVNFTGTVSPKISDANTFSTLSRVNAGSDKSEMITLGANQTIANNGTLTLTGGSDNRYRILVTSDTLGTRRTITLGTSVTTNITRADFRDIGFTDPIDLSGITGGAGDALGNNNITFNTPRNMYWKTSTSGTKYYSNYNGANPWYSETNGGGTNYTDSPLPQDNVYFDASSVSGATAVSMDQSRPSKDLNFNGATSSLTFNIMNDWTMYGSLTMSNNVTYGNAGAYYIYLEGRGNHTIASNGKTFINTPVFRGYGGTYSLSDNFTTLDVYFTVSAGTFSAGAYNITTGNVAVTGGTVNMGSGTWKLTRNVATVWYSTYIPTINAENSTLELSGSSSSAVSGIGNLNPVVFNNINISGKATGTGEWDLTNNFTVNGIFTIAGPNRVRVTGGRTITMGPSSSIVWNGTVGNLIDINVASGTTPWSISRPSGTQTFLGNYLNLGYSTAVQTNTFYASNSTNGTGNTNWIFANLPDAPIGLIASYGDSQISLSWTTPVSDGGTPITDYVIGYKLTSEPTVWSIFADGVSANTNGIVIGLTNGSSYDFRTSAVNAIGQGPASNIATATPMTVPGAPTIGTATAGNAQVSVAFTPPVSDGGSTILYYTATSSPGGITATGTSSPIVVTGLTNGTSYTFTVTATNSAGTSPASSSSNSIVPATVPDVPTGLSAIPSNAQVSLSWTAPVDNGGSAITDYVVEYKPSSEPTVWSIFNDGVSLNTNTIVTSLANGSSYDFRISALNTMGQGSPSSLLSSIPFTIPDAPINVVAVSGNSQATISFSPPVFNGGSEITSYTVTSNPSSIIATGTSSPIVVTGLTNGTPYTFTVTATNSAGTSLASDSSNSIIPATIPDMPTSLLAVAGVGQVALSWTAPVNNGGSAITDYVVEYKLSSEPTVWSVFSDGVSTNTNAIVVSLSNGVSYDFRVSAVNNAGQGDPSIKTNAMPVTVPDAPTGVSAVGGNSQATISFSPPLFNGGSTINNYTVTSSPGNFTNTGGSSPIVVTGLTNGTSYTFTVTATNAVGTGIASTPSNSVIPATVPDAPTAVSAIEGNSQATISFTIPSFNGGSPITSYTVTSSPGNFTGTGNASPIIVAGLTNGSTYTFTVTATNAVGVSPASSPSNSITLSTEPSPPVNLATEVLSGSIGLSWSPSVSNGGSNIIDYVVEYKLTTGGVWSIFADGTNTNTTAIVTGLSNGTSYDFRIKAVNIVGESIPSSIASATPGEPAQVIVQNFSDLTVQNIGTNVRITNEGTVSYEYQYTWCITDSASNLCGGGDDIFSSTAAKLINSGENWDTNLVSTVNIPGDYYFHIKVIYGSESSNAYQSFTALATVPDAPTNPSAVASNRQASVSFTAPSFDGGSVITGYVVTSNPGGITGTGNTSPIIVAGLTNGVNYTFTITAINAIGTSIASVPTNSVMPVTVPNPPTGVMATAGNTQVSLSWIAPNDDGGSPVIDYIIEYKPASELVWIIFADGISTMTNATVTGLTNNVTYDFRVSAVNAFGQSSENSINYYLQFSNNNGGGGGYIYPPKPPVINSPETVVENKEKPNIEIPIQNVEKAKEKNKTKIDNKEIKKQDNGSQKIDDKKPENEVQATPVEKPKVSIFPDVKVDTKIKKIILYAVCLLGAIIILGGGIMLYFRRRKNIEFLSGKSPNDSKDIFKEKNLVKKSKIKRKI